MMHTFKPKSSLVLTLAALGGAAHAAPVALTMTTDTVYSATATIAGEIPDRSDPRWSSLHGPDVLTGLVGVDANGSYEKWQVIDDMSAGTNWKASVNIYAYDYYDVSHNLLCTTYALTVEGQHMVAPHDGELAPNPIKLGMWHFNLSGATSTDPLVAVYLTRVSFADDEAHPVGPHHDTGTLTITDLDPAGPSLLNGRTIQAQVTFTHPVPAPAALPALAGLVAARRRRG